MIANLRENGASEEEIAFMFADWEEHKCLRRVELNALTSPQMVEFIERKLKENDIEKIVPSEEGLEEAYRLFTRTPRSRRWSRRRWMKSMTMKMKSRFRPIWKSVSVTTSSSIPQSGGTRR